MKKWKCTICNYIHEGPEPPEVCPICGAGPEKFIELKEDESEEPAAAQAAATQVETRSAADDAGQGEPGALAQQILKHHLHPMSVHVPNGVIPVTFVFVVLATVLDYFAMSEAAFYNLIFVALSLPVVWISGWVEWRKRYSGALTKRFIVKIISASVVTLLTVILIIWHVVDPQVVNEPSILRWLFLGLHFAMLLGASVAGFIGGKLVFKE